MSVPALSSSRGAWRTRLVNGQEIWVWGAEWARARYERLVRLCRAVWHRLPLGPRRALCRRARRAGRGMTIVATDWIVGRACYALAGFRVAALRIEVTGEVMDRLGDEAAMALIVHELAHVYRLEVGLDGVGWEEDYDEAVAEGEADILVSKWGFELDALERWEDDNRAYLSDLERRWSGEHDRANGNQGDGPAGGDPG